MFYLNFTLVTNLIPPIDEKYSINLIYYIYISCYIINMAFRQEFA